MDSVKIAQEGQDQIILAIHRLKKLLKEVEWLYLQKEFKKAKEIIWICNCRIEELEKEMNARQYHTGEYVSGKNDSEDTYEKLGHFNEEILKIQKVIKFNLKEIVKDMEQRISDKLLYDYEIDLKVDYMIGDDDPYAGAGQEYIISRQEHTLALTLENDDDENLNWNDTPSGLMSEQQHCYMFHDLYSHVRPRLSEGDILRIKQVLVNINVIHQKFFEIT